MKKLILFPFMLALSSFINLGATTVQLEKKDVVEIPGRPRAPMLIPLTIDLSTIDLYLYFNTSVGITSIIVTNEEGLIIHQELIDSDTNNEFYIPIDNWEDGNYKIQIVYGSITLIGTFTLQ